MKKELQRRLKNLKNIKACIDVTALNIAYYIFYSEEEVSEKDLEMYNNFIKDNILLIQKNYQEVFTGRGSMDILDIVGGNKDLLLNIGNSHGTYCYFENKEKIDGVPKRINNVLTIIKINDDIIVNKKKNKRKQFKNKILNIFGEDLETKIIMDYLNEN